ncbi:methyltransferase type 11 [marine bacterium AO1-C]|nr:methyltransferase type 11 [marine bacterium AO1-C]
MKRYIHGYSETEAQRLSNQANSIAEYLHFDSVWQPGSTILEVGCGVGAQTVIIADKNPDCKIVSIDISKKSIAQAQQKVQEAGMTNVEFRLQDVNELIKGKKEIYDHVFICFVLEHISEPQQVLQNLKSIIKPGGTITVIEGDHGSTFFYPENDFARKVIDAQVKLQQGKGGNANIGREVYPLLSKAGFQEIVVSPRQIYVDGTRPALVDGFIKNTFTAMMQGMSETVLKEGLVSKSDYDLGIEGLLRTAEADGVFSYTFFKGIGVNL